MIAIHEVSGTDLYHRYPNQSAPQPCHVELDLRAGTLTAAYDPELESGAPEAVAHGHTRRWSIPALKEAAANALLERVAPLAQRVAAGYSARWNGAAYVAAFTADALAALDGIEALCDATFAAKADRIVVEHAEDWFRPYGASEREQARSLSACGDIDIVDIAAREAGIAESYGVDVIDGLDDYLRRLRNAAGEAA